MSARMVKHVRDTIARDLVLYHERKGWDWSPEEILAKGLEKAERMAAKHAESGDRYGYAPVYTAVADELRRLLARMHGRRAVPLDRVVDEALSARVCVHGERADLRTRDDRPVCAICRRAEALAAELELLNGEHRALLGPVDRTGARDETELARFMARCKNLDAREAQLRTAHFPDAATLDWQAGTWFTCDQHGENHRTIWTEQDGLVDDVAEPDAGDEVPSRALMLRPFHLWDEVEIDGQPGVIVELRDEAVVRGPGVYLLASMTGFPFPAWDAVGLTPDRTRPADGRTLEWIDVPAVVVDDEETSPSFTCPRCGATSHNPNDAAEGYCGRCHDWTRSRFAPPDDAKPFRSGIVPPVCTGCAVCYEEAAPSSSSQAGLASLVGAR